MSKAAPYVWRHPDGRRIEVYPNEKVWVGRRLKLNRLPRQKETDEEWYVSPGPEWKGCSYNDLPPHENIPIQQ